MQTQLSAFSLLFFGSPQWLWCAVLAGAHHLETDGTHLSCVKDMENKPVCHFRLITVSNVSAEGALSVAWEHHLPVSNVLYIISHLPHVLSLLVFEGDENCQETRQMGAASLLSSDNKYPTPKHRRPKKDGRAIIYYMFGLLIFFFLYGLDMGCGLLKLYSTCVVWCRCMSFA